MIVIIAGTNRPQSRSREIAEIVCSLYREIGEDCEIMDLKDVGLEDLRPEHYGAEKPAKIKQAVAKLLDADGIHLIVPEYNGSMPGALKYFIDQWQYPESFEHRPVCFIGLGGRFGGLRPVEHLQQVFGYRNGFVFPDRVFIGNVWNVLKAGVIEDQTICDLLKKQAQGFGRFVRALKSENLHGKEYKFSK